MDLKLKYIKYKNKYLNIKNNVELNKINNETNLSNKNIKKNSVKKLKNKNFKQANVSLINSINSINSTEGNKLIMENNKSIIEPNYIEHLSEPWFSLILLGLKTVEGRKNKGKFKDMKIGETIMWTNSDFMERKVMTRIIGKDEYPTFEKYLEIEGLDKCLPGMEKFGLEHGLSVYFKYYTKEDEKNYGVVAIKIELI